MHDVVAVRIGERPAAGEVERQIAGRWQTPVLRGNPQANPTLGSFSQDQQPELGTFSCQPAKARSRVG